MAEMTSHTGPAASAPNSLSTAADGSARVGGAGADAGGTATIAIAAAQAEIHGLQKENVIKCVPLAIATSLQ